MELALSAPSGTGWMTPLRPAPPAPTLAPTGLGLGTAVGLGGGTGLVWGTRTGGGAGSGRALAPPPTPARRGWSRTRGRLPLLWAAELAAGASQEQSCRALSGLMPLCVVT